MQDLMKKGIYGREINEKNFIVIFIQFKWSTDFFAAIEELLTKDF